MDLYIQLDLAIDKAHSLYWANEHMEHVLEPLYTQQQCIAPIKQLQRKGSDYKLLGKLIRLMVN